ncbi:MurR/RpiR family transcriptional regulator [Pediococcus cellicola]|uniref:Transcriptional regulator n=1 Tax=Pediococcus cellicola TaxID=319652 RepID=A0A0R2IY93_9LACO|nr:MurR/RpiR family transcriptional regulator [Pediococcus cellicola]KRN66951.1 transcriptional regulator [Pediococcus cellicola]GEL15116.1 hypothetical protein PCE01_09180 [Pediococcus cellicola]
MDLKEFLKPKNDVFSKTDQKIYNVVLQYPIHIQLLTIQKIASDSGTSVASVQRYCKKLGYSGFKEFKFQLKEFLFQQQSSNRHPSDYLSRYLKVVNAFKAIDKNIIATLASDLLNARLNYAVGLYYSALPAKQLSMGLRDLGKPSLYTNDYITASHWNDLMNKADTFVFFSISGDEANLKNYLAEPLHKLDKTYLITFNADTLLKADFNHVIVLPGKSFVYNTSVDPQSLVSLFVEMVIEYTAQHQK